MVKRKSIPPIRTYLIKFNGGMFYTDADSKENALVQFAKYCPNKKMKSIVLSAVTYL